MATVAAVTEAFGENAVRVTWPDMKQGDEGEVVYWSRHSDRSIQVLGTFGGASVQVKGSNDGTNFVTLTDLRGTALSIGTAGIEQVEDCTFAIKPVISAGNGTTALTAVLFAKKGG